MAPSVYEVANRSIDLHNIANAFQNYASEVFVICLPEQEVIVEE